MRVAELLMLIGVLLLLEATYTAAQPQHGVGVKQRSCRERCGDVSIPYPFGTTKECYHDEQFLITCNDTFDPPKAFLMASNIRVTDISIEGKLRIMQFIAKDCYDKSGAKLRSNKPYLYLSKFIISDTDNKFVAVGCDTQATIQGYQANQRICYYTTNPTQPVIPRKVVSSCSQNKKYDSHCLPTTTGYERKKVCYDIDQANIQKKRYTTGCIARCGSIDYVANYSCSGLGCCQTSIPKGMTNFTVTVSSYDNHTGVYDFNPCSYAFVVEESKFNFSSIYLSNLTGAQLPAVLDWSIGNETCEILHNKSMKTACQRNSICYDPDNGSGYRCKCLEGYQGNPYLGCLDIDECQDKNRTDCKMICENTEGNYTCSCPKEFHGDGRKSGEGCIADAKQSKVIEIIVGVGVATIVFLIGSFWFYVSHKKQKLILLKKKFLNQNKEKFFKQNGLSTLQQLKSGQERTTETTNIFTAEELEKATNNYDESRIVGKGDYGTFYKGDLEDGRTVTIKKSKRVHVGQIEQVINEIIVLSRITHKNVAKLLGCCLETEVPLLVYEFITNGTLFDHIHKSKASTISWKFRLKIAVETAGVLSDLHSFDDPIIHRDVKSANILLDNSFTAKVYNFGASRLAPVDHAELSTMMQGTLGYLDPIYLQTSQLTKNSDVYSFGVILVELLTGKMAFSFDKPENERNLSMYFLLAMEEGRLEEILEHCVVDKMTACIEVAKIAKSCLEMGKARPAMKKVKEDLLKIKETS